MWIRYAAWIALHDQLAVKRGETDFLSQRLVAADGALIHQYEATAAAVADAATLKEQNRVLQSHLDWLRVRVNQIEEERARLIEKALAIQVSVPTISAVRPDPGDAAAVQAKIASLFEDVGDDEAHRLGIEHDAAGSVVYRG